MEFGSAKDIAAGKYVEVVRDRRVVFTWGWEGNEMVPPGSRLPNEGLNGCWYVSSPAEAIEDPINQARQ